MGIFHSAGNSGRVVTLNFDAPIASLRPGTDPPSPTPWAWPPIPLSLSTLMSAVIVPPLAASMKAAFKKVRRAIGGPPDPALLDLIVGRIVE